MISNPASVADLAARVNYRMADLAQALLGDPNPAHTTKTQLRYGGKGSLAVEVAGPRAGRWYDHEAGVGGDGLELIKHHKGLPDAEVRRWARDWLGDIQHRPTPSSTQLPRSVNILHYRAEQGFIPPDPVIISVGRQFSHRAQISRPLWASMIASHRRVACRRILKGRKRRRLADGLAHRARALRLLGNGVHPLAAAHAWRSLASAHGLRPVNLATERCAVQPSADEPF